MRKLSYVLSAILVTTLMSFVIPEAAKTYRVDTENSKLKWTGYHLAKSYEHYGYVKIKSGSIGIENNVLSSGTIIIDMNSITNTDLTKERKNAKLVKHLKSDDFFGVEKHPEAKLVIKRSNLKSHNIYKTVADLTIKGITKEIEFDTKVNTLTEEEFLATATLRIQRTDFKVMYGWSVENAMLDGEFQMDVKIVAKK